MRGGAIAYSPLPCNDDGSTAWDSTAQVGHETCVEYGTHGAEQGSRDEQSLKGMTPAQVQELIDARISARGTVTNPVAATTQVPTSS